MSTSNGNGPFDEEMIRRIANAMFRAKPGESPELPFSDQAQNNYQAAEFPDNLDLNDHGSGMRWAQNSQDELRELGLNIPAMQPAGGANGHPESSLSTAFPQAVPAGPGNLLNFLAGLPSHLDVNSRSGYGGPAPDGPYPMAATPAFPAGGASPSVPSPVQVSGGMFQSGQLPLNAAPVSGPTHLPQPGSSPGPLSFPGMNVPVSVPNPGAPPQLPFEIGALPEPLQSALKLLQERSGNTRHDFEKQQAAVKPEAVTTRSAGAPVFYFLRGADPTLPDADIEEPASAIQPRFDIDAVRRDFPILNESVNGHQLIWFDNAATTQKPKAVIDRLTYFYEHENSNIHRAAHTLAARSTDAYEQAREKVRAFLGASSTKEIVFVRGATEAINLVAQSWGRQNIQAGDEILITWLEHHANIVPWQQLAKEKGARLKVAPVDELGQITLDDFGRLLGPKVKLVAFAHVSNALGTITPVKEMIQMAHYHGAKVLVDGAQAVSHIRVNVQELDPDFYVFSGHKVFGPTGIGVVYGKEDILNSMPPWQTGGNMISDVTFERSLFQNAPMRFEAGTGSIADAVGLGAAIDYISRIGLEAIAEYEHQLLCCLRKNLRTIPGLRLFGGAKEKTSVASFVIDGFTTEEIGQALSKRAIAVRSGHHCAQPILRRFGVESTVRPSLAFYNTQEEIDVLIDTLRKFVSTRNRA